MPIFRGLDSKTAANGTELSGTEVVTETCERCERGAAVAAGPGTGRANVESIHTGGWGIPSVLLESLSTGMSRNEQQRLNPTRVIPGHTTHAH